MRDGHTGADRRAHERIPCKQVLAVYQQSGSLLSTLLGSKRRSSPPLPVRNISRGGLCLLCKEELKPEQDIRMVINLGHRKPKLRAQGKVRWWGPGEGIYPYKAGVGFTGMPHKSWEILCRLEGYLSEADDWKRWRLRSKEKASRPFGMAEPFERPPGK